MKKQTKKPIVRKNQVRSFQAVSSSINLSKRTLLIIAALFIAVGVSYLAFSSAEDPSSVAVNIIKTQYDYPANAIFVSPGGVDSGTRGTKDAPLRTLTYAVRSKAVAGDTIVMRAGTYREAVGTISKALTIQAYPNEEVWLDGSDEVTGWVAEGSLWRKDGWVAANAMCPKNSPQPNVANPDASENYSCYTAGGEGSQVLVTSENPASFLPDMFFVNGVQLKQVMARAEVKAGTFYVNRDTNQVFIGDNPSGKLVEGSTRQQAIQYYQSAVAGSKLRGIGVRRFASKIVFTSKPGEIEVSNGAKGIEFDNMVFTQSAGSGLFLTGSSSDKSTGLVVKNSLFATNGTSGLSGNYTDGTNIENNIFYNNNTEKAQWEGTYGSYAGAKFARLSNATVKNNLFQDNYGTGFWCDLACQSVAITGNMSRGNLVNGIYYEISLGGILASNVTYNNGRAGLKASGQQIKIYNNTSYNNGVENIFSYDDPDASRIASANIEIKNNITASGPRTTANSPLLRLWMSRTNIGQTVTALDNNLYFRSSAGLPKDVLQWVGTNANYTYTTLDSTLKSQTGRETSGLLVDGKAIGTLFKDAPSGDFKLVSGSAAVNSGAALPADVANALGLNAGQVVSRGAVSWRNGSSSSITVATPDPVTPPPAPVNQAPTASVTVSKNSITLSAGSGAAFQVNATANDPDGSITKLEILQNNAVVYTCYNAASCRYDANGYGAGTFTYAARAYDNATPTAITTSATQSVVVNAAASPTTPVPTPQPSLSKPTGISFGLDQGFLSYGMGLRWSPVTNATGYKVTYTQDGQAPTTKAQTASTFSQSSITIGKIYTFDIVATNGTTESPKTTVKAQASCGWWVFNCSIKQIP